MSQHHHELWVEVDPVHVTATLDIRPSGWWRPFLVLATGVGAGPIPATHRIGRPRRTEHGDTTLRFTWRPHRDDLVFAELTGHWSVTPDGEGAALALTGQATGGVDGTADVVVRRLVLLVGRALSAGQQPLG